MHSLSSSSGSLLMNARLRASRSPDPEELVGLVEAAWTSQPRSPDVKPIVDSPPASRDDSTSSILQCSVMVNLVLQSPGLSWPRYPASKMSGSSHWWTYPGSRICVGLGSGSSSPPTAAGLDESSTNAGLSGRRGAEKQIITCIINLNIKLQGFDSAKLDIST